MKAKFFFLILCLSAVLLNGQWIPGVGAAVDFSKPAEVYNSPTVHVMGKLDFELSGFFRHSLFSNVFLGSRFDYLSHSVEKEIQISENITISETFNLKISQLTFRLGYKFRFQDISMHPYYSYSKCWVTEYFRASKTVCETGHGGGVIVEAGDRDGFGIFADFHYRSFPGFRFGGFSIAFGIQLNVNPFKRSW